MPGDERNAKRRMTKDEWLRMARDLFGPVSNKWRFVCPVCGHEQAVADFMAYRDRGATPDSAATECIGRYTKGRSALYDKGDGPCDYAAYGLLRLAPVIVTDGKDEMQVFAFAAGAREVA